MNTIPPMGGVDIEGVSIADKDAVTRVGRHEALSPSPRSCRGGERGQVQLLAQQETGEQEVDRISAQQN